MKYWITKGQVLLALTIASLGLLLLFTYRSFDEYYGIFTNSFQNNIEQTFQDAEHVEVIKLISNQIIKPLYKEYINDSATSGSFESLQFRNSLKDSIKDLCHQFFNSSSLDINEMLHQIDSSLLPKNAIANSFLARLHETLTSDGVTYTSPLIQKSENSIFTLGAIEMDSFYKTFNILLQYNDRQLQYKIIDQQLPLIETELYKKAFIYQSFISIPTYWLIHNYIRGNTNQVLLALAMLLLSTLALLGNYRNWQRQRKLNELKSNFINNITHELKTPVSTAMLAMEVLLDPKTKADDELLRRYLEMANEEIIRLNHFTSRVLEYSKVQKTPSCNFESTPISTLINQIIDSRSISTRDKEVSIHYKDQTSNTNIFIDKLYVESIIINLIDNSIKYGNDDVLIDIESYNEKNKVVVSVSDNGPGIPEKQMNKIFKSFVRVPNNSQIDPPQGFGLGLSFAKMIMEKHNGKIRARNLSPKGCVFELVFPVNDIPKQA